MIKFEFVLFSSGFLFFFLVCFGDAVVSLSLLPFGFESFLIKQRYPTNKRFFGANTIIGCLGVPCLHKCCLN